MAAGAGIRKADVDQASALLAEIDRRVAEALREPPVWQPVHGDVHPCNFRFDRSGALHLLDLEWAHMGLAEIDLASASRRLRSAPEGLRGPGIEQAYENAGGGETLARYARRRGLWLAVHDLARAASVARRIRRGKSTQSQRTPAEWILCAQRALESLP
jgi:aminoglycoside phosphotransferase (APT) family kinase protein